MFVWVWGGLWCLFFVCGFCLELLVFEFGCLGKGFDVVLVFVVCS